MNDPAVRVTDDGSAAELVFLVCGRQMPDRTPLIFAQGRAHDAWLAEWESKSKLDKARSRMTSMRDSQYPECQPDVDAGVKATADLVKRMGAASRKTDTPS